MATVSTVVGLKPYGKPLGLKPDSPSGQIVRPFVRAPPILVVKASDHTYLHNQTKEKITLWQEFSKFQIVAKPNNGITKLAVNRLESSHNVQISVGDPEKYRTTRKLTFENFVDFQDMFFSCPEEKKLAVHGYRRPKKSRWRIFSGKKISSEEETEQGDKKEEIITTDLIEKT